MRGLAELVKSLMKIAIIGIVAWQSIRAEENYIVKLMDQDLAVAAVYISSTAIDVAIKICAMMLIIAILDYGYQWWQYEKDLRMTKQEVKEEYRDGRQPRNKAENQAEAEMSMRRMLSRCLKPML